MKKTVFIFVSACVFLSCTKSKDNKAHFVVNSSASRVEWKGSAPDHFHIGSFSVTGDFFGTRSGRLDSGSFTIPIASITDFDLVDPLKEQLLTHLKGPEFFNMVLHPNASFQITKVDTYSITNPADGSNYLMTGQFTLIGQTHELSFPVKIIATSDSLIANASFSFNRLTWGMTSYSDPKGPLYILPDINIDLHISAAALK